MIVAAADGEKPEVILDPENASSSVAHAGRVRQQARAEHMAVATAAANEEGVRDTGGA